MKKQKKRKQSTMAKRAVAKRSVVNAGSFLKNPSTQLLGVAGIELKELGKTVAIPFGTWVGSQVTTKLLTKVINKRLGKLSFLGRHVGPLTSTVLLAGGWYATKTKMLEKYRNEILAGLFFTWGVEILQAYLPIVFDWMFKIQPVQTPVVIPQETVDPKQQSVTISDGIDVFSPNVADDMTADEDLTFDNLVASNN